MKSLARDGDSAGRRTGRRAPRSSAGLAVSAGAVTAGAGAAGSSGAEPAGGSFAISATPRTLGQNPDKITDPPRSGRRRPGGRYGERTR
ncbi:hypothetical protein GCM10022247_70080 [Allokutzneria multivorans]|uniref:Uncharacterized protein n=1 Tax=Allokutzneria multivorans TaxID=1142134 RepID=A0ABP7U2K8_9PSEU